MAAAANLLCSLAFRSPEEVYWTGSDAIADAESQVGGIARHLGLLNGEPNGNASNHWRTELRAMIGKVQDQVRHMGRRTGADWQRRVDQWRRELDRLTPD